MCVCVCVCVCALYEILTLALARFETQEVEKARRAAEWGKPDLARLRAFLSKHLGFTEDDARTEKTLLPLATAFYFRQPGLSDYLPHRVVGEKRIRDRTLYKVQWYLKSKGPPPSALPGGSKCVGVECVSLLQHRLCFLTTE